MIAGLGPFGSELEANSDLGVNGFGLISQGSQRRGRVRHHWSKILNRHESEHDDREERINCNERQGEKGQGMEPESKAVFADQSRAWREVIGISAKLVESVLFVLLAICIREKLGAFPRIVVMMKPRHPEADGEPSPRNGGYDVNASEEFGFCETKEDSQIKHRAADAAAGDG